MSGGAAHEELTLLVRLEVARALVGPDGTYSYELELCPMIWDGERTRAVGTVRSALGELASEYGALRLRGWAEGPGRPGLRRPVFTSAGVVYAGYRVQDLAGVREQVRTLERIDRRLAVLARRLGHPTTFDTLALRFADALGVDRFTFRPEELRAIRIPSDTEPRFLRLDRTTCGDLLRRLEETLLTPRGSAANAEAV